MEQFEQQIYKALEIHMYTLWPPDVQSLLTGKDPDAGKDWRQKKGAAEDELVR